MQYLHEMGISHNDIKPENILITDEGVVKLCDFGLVNRDEVNSRVIGTPEYWPPEAHHGIAVKGMQADVFALGIVLFGMVLGRPPFSYAK